MIMMIGLPGSGKTTWVNKHVSENSGKQYNVISTTTMIEKMTVNGEPRKKHHKGKWEQVVQKATRSLQEMLRAASQRRRNVIIDQVGRHVSVLVWVCCALSSAVHHHQHHSNNQKNICPSLEENYSRRKCRTIQPVLTVQSINDSELRHTQCTVKYRY